MFFPHYMHCNLVVLKHIRDPYVTLLHEKKDLFIDIIPLLMCQHMTYCIIIMKNKPLYK